MQTTRLPIWRAYSEICVNPRKSALQIRQPPIASALLHTRKPPAQRIQQQHTRNPREINNREIEPDARLWPAEVDRRLPQPARRLPKRKVQDDRNDVGCEPLKQVEEKRHTPKRHEEVSYRTSGSSRFKQRERENRRPKRHQKKQQRRRILRGIHKRENSENDVRLL